jgi:hypothetical protein
MAAWRPSTVISFSLSTVAWGQEGRCKATWERESKLPWREAGPPNHHDNQADSDQEVVNKELSLSMYFMMSVN